MEAWTRAGFVLGVGLLAGLMCKVWLPSDRFLSFMYRDVYHVVRLNSFAFWFCAVIAVIVGAILVFRHLGLR